MVDIKLLKIFKWFFIALFSIVFLLLPLTFGIIIFSHGCCSCFEVYGPFEEIGCLEVDNNDLLIEIPDNSKVSIFLNSNFYSLGSGCKHAFMTSDILRYESYAKTVEFKLVKDELLLNGSPFPPSSEYEFSNNLYWNPWMRENLFIENQGHYPICNRDSKIILLTGIDTTDLDISKGKLILLVLFLFVLLFHLLEKLIIKKTQSWYLCVESGFE